MPRYKIHAIGREKCNMGERERMGMCKEKKM